MNINNKLTQGFSLTELLVGTVLTSILFSGFMLFSSGIWKQLSYEDVHEKVQQYGNYILNDIAREFLKTDIQRIDLSLFESNYDIIRIYYNDDFNYTQYSSESGSGQINDTYQRTITKNRRPIHRENDSMNQFYNEFENKGYSVSISKFKCARLGVNNSMAKYGNRSFDSNDLKDATYIVDMQVEIYKKNGDNVALYNTIDFQRTLFMKNKIIETI